MTFQRYYLFMNCINNPFRLGKEGIFHFMSGNDPVPGTYNHRRCIKVIKSQFSDSLGHLFQE